MKKIAISIALFSYVAAGSLFAAEIEDSFGSAKKIESKYFTIHYSQQIDISKLSQQLNITTADKILAGRNIDDDIVSEHGIAGMIDIL